MRKRMMAVLLAFIVMAYAGAAQGSTGATGADAAPDAAMDLGADAAAEGSGGAQGPMDMNSMTPVDQLTPAAGPRYPAGARVVLETDHMAFMQGAEGVVSGAFDTTLYAVDYTAADGAVVENHRWVIAEEIENSAGKTFAAGDTVTLGRGHMEPLGGAGLSAVVRQAAQGPAYMVDYDPTDGGARVVNHQWVAEFELRDADAPS